MPEKLKMTVEMSIYTTNPEPASPNVYRRSLAIFFNILIRRPDQIFCT